MKKYQIIYKCNNGFEGEEFIMAANRTMALEIFEGFEYFRTVVSVECFLVDVYEDDDEEYNPLEQNLTKLLNLSEQILTVAYDNDDDHLEYLAHELKATIEYMMEDFDI